MLFERVLSACSKSVSLAVAALVLAFSCGQAVTASAGEMTVSAAASLTNAFAELKTAFEKSHQGLTVHTNFAASNPLLKQMQEGAPVDVFASADQETMDKAQKARLIKPESRRNFVSNTVVLIVPAQGKKFDSLADLTKARRRQGRCLPDAHGPQACHLSHCRSHHRQQCCHGPGVRGFRPFSRRTGDPGPLRLLQAVDSDGGVAGAAVLFPPGPDMSRLLHVRARHVALHVSGPAVPPAAGARVASACRRPVLALPASFPGYRMEHLVPTDLVRPLLLSLRVAGIATALSFLAALFVAWRLARRRGPLPALLDALCTLPLVLPPTVLGYYLILVVGRNGLLGPALRDLGLQLIFSWQGAVVAATVVVFPLLYKSARAALEQVDPHLENAARTLGASELRILLTVSLPLAWKGIFAGLMLAFARGMGEFGATLMVAGNIPGKTQTLALAIYDAFQAGNDALATLLVLVTSGLCVMLLMAAEVLVKYKRRRRSA